jgi:hypothetical protein
VPEKIFVMTAPPARSSRIVIPEQPRWHQRLAARLVWLLLSAISLTIRYRWTDRSGLREGKLTGATIYCIWHNRLALSMVCYFRYIRHHCDTPGLATMVSASKDGALMAAVLDCFHVQPIRGSTSRRGPQALRELSSWSKKKFTLALTPDGPRGPRYIAQPGIIALAQLTGMPIVPVSYNLSWKISVKSWDRFQIPLPFSRCDMFFQPPIHVPREATDTDRESFRLQLEQSLNSVSTD